MEASYTHVRSRRDFGKFADFKPQPAEVLFDLRPNEEFAQEHIERNLISVGVQAAKPVSEHEANTTQVLYTTSSMSHTEGGWPKEVDATEAESVIRYRKKVEKDEHYIKTVVKLAGVVEDLIKCNNAIDIYEEYFPEAPPEPASSGPASAKTVAVLRDPCGDVGRTAQYVAWHPDGSRRLAVAYCIMEFQGQPADMPLGAPIWDLTASATAPETLLQPASALTCINYSLRDHNVLGAGMFSGQFGVFDPRKGAAAVDITPVKTSHTDPVFDFAWQQSKSGTEAMTVSMDGLVLWWDTRKLQEPIDMLPLDVKGSTGRAHAVSLDYTLAAGPTKFLVGTDAGAVISCNRKGGKTPADRVGSSFTGHLGPVYAVSRHPTLTRYFLGFGGWSGRLWTEELRSPLVVMPNQAAWIAAGRWSPTRPGVFYTGKQDGMLDVWDYYDKQHEAALSIRISDSAIRTLRAREGGRELAVGSTDGSVTLLQLSASLSEPQPNERSTVSAMFERETNREKAVEKAAKEAKVKARKAADAAKAAQAPDPAVEEAAILQAEIDFYRISGITPPADSPAAAILMAQGGATADAHAAAGDASAAAAGTSDSGSAARNGKEEADQSVVGASAS